MGLSDRRVVRRLEHNRESEVCKDEEKLVFGCSPGDLWAAGGGEETEGWSERNSLMLKFVTKRFLLNPTSFAKFFFFKKVEKTKLCVKSLNINSERAAHVKCFF